MREIISAPWEHMGSQTIYCVVGMSLHIDLQLLAGEDRRGGRHEPVGPARSRQGRRWRRGQEATQGKAQGGARKRGQGTCPSQRQCDEDRCQATAAEHRDLTLTQGLAVKALTRHCDWRWDCCRTVGNTTISEEMSRLYIVKYWISWFILVCIGLFSLLQHYNIIINLLSHSYYLLLL